MVKGRNYLLEIASGAYLHRRAILNITFCCSVVFLRAQYGAFIEVL